MVKSSAHYYGCERDDPAYFTEQMPRPHPPSTPIERDIVEAEEAVSEFARRNPEVSVTVLRFANAIGAGVITSHMRLFSLPVVPTILGFDPRYQFIHEDDIVGALEFVVREDLPGVYNGAGDGVLVLSEVLSLLGKPMAPVLPPLGTGLLAGPLSRVGLRIPVEMLNQLRYGRGIDNRRLKAAGYAYRYTTREAVIKQAEYMRARPLLRGAREPYRYEQEVEEFLRWSPNVRRSGASAGKAWRPSPRQVHELQRALGALGERPAQRGGPSEPAEANMPTAEYDTLEAVEVIAVLPSLTRSDLETLRTHESTGAQRTAVIEAIDRLLAPDRSADG